MQCAGRHPVLNITRLLLRAAPVLSIFIAVTFLTLLVQGCSRRGKDSNKNSPSNSASIVSTPPYRTTEPDTYQAKYRSTTNFGDESSPLAKIAGVSNKEWQVAKSGTKRREDFAIESGAQISLIQSGTEKTILIPAKRIYATLEFKGDGSEGATGVPASIDPAIEIPPEGSSYEKTGTETVNGRATTRYKVTPAGGAAGNSETMIWIDPELGLPIKWQIKSGRANGDEITYTIEMIDYNPSPDSRLFEVPADYQRVTYEKLRQF